MPRRQLLRMEEIRDGDRTTAIREAVLSGVTTNLEAVFRLLSGVKWADGTLPACYVNTRGKKRRKT